MNNRITTLLGNEVFLSDGGLETDMFFNKGIDLTHMAAFTLYDMQGGKQILDAYYTDYLKLALRYRVNFILETPTWRCNKDWGAKLGYTPADLDKINRIAVEHMKSMRQAFETDSTHIIISGNIGPRGDGYTPTDMLNVATAESYHSDQIATFKNAGVDLVSAFTMNYLDEALGIVNAAMKMEIPVVISFTLETDGRLPDGGTFENAIETVDRTTGSYPLYYMVNCAHPLHFKDKLGSLETLKRVKGLRANSSTKSHEELDNSVEIDKGDMDLLAREYLDLRNSLPALSVIGGCCGTDHTHIARICETIL